MFYCRNKQSVLVTQLFNLSKAKLSKNPEPMQLKHIGVISLKSGAVVIEGTTAQAYL